jgi:hypothetical protein
VAAFGVMLLGGIGNLKRLRQENDGFRIFIFFQSNDMGCDTL